MPDDFNGNLAKENRDLANENAALRKIVADLQERLKRFNEKEDNNDGFGN